MQPRDLNADAFKTYPPEGYALALANLTLITNLPLGFLPFLLKDTQAFDWQFPIEQTQLKNQFRYLADDGRRKQEMQPFAQLALSPELTNFDWVNRPAQFLERLSAHLWTTRQMDGFRTASEAYVRRFHSWQPEAKPAAARLGVAVFGEGATAAHYALFRRLRTSGVYYRAVNPKGGADAIHETLRIRAEKHPIPYAHWSIDGAEATASFPGVCRVSYNLLKPVRERLAALMLKAYRSEAFDPEALRTQLAEVTPSAAGMAADGVLERFQLTLLTEGSGTQIFSTTFVQWAAREALRRAQPITLYTRYAPRQKQKNMDELLRGGSGGEEAHDADGSLIDGDMGAFYTWINLRRLAGGDDARFLAWLEGRNEAFAISPRLKAGTESASPIDLRSLLEVLS